MLAPLLMLILFGIIEFGVLFKDLLIIYSACRESARFGAVGASRAGMIQKALDSAPTLRAEDVSDGLELDYRVFLSGYWGEWQRLEDTGDVPPKNWAQKGDQLRVRLEYPHALITGQLFSCLSDDEDGVTVNLRSSMVVRRE